MAKADPRLVLRKHLATLDNEALGKRYAKLMGRTPGSVKFALENGRLTREVMEDTIVYAAHRTG